MNSLSSATASAARQPPRTDSRLAGFVRSASEPIRLVELFVVANLAFLAIDIYLAHSVNSFAHPGEWIPLVFSLAAPLLLVGGMIAAGGLTPPARFVPGFLAGRNLARAVGLLVGAGSVLVGVAGLVLHLESQFFQEQTLRSLVYTAPFVAPLSYAGIGLLILLNRMPPPESADWSRWVLVLALGGFVGNFILSLADHAQGGLLDWPEWIPVVSSAVAIGALLAAVQHFRNRPFLSFCLVVMLAQVAVAVLGWGLHLAAILSSPMDSLWSKVLFSAPVFAPLLFADMAILACVPLWDLRRGATVRASVDESTQLA